MPTSLHLFFLSAFGGVAGLLGGFFFLYHTSWSRVLERFAVPFSAGALTTVALIGLVPEAMEMIGTLALWIVVAAFFGSYLFEKLFIATHHHSHEHEHHHNPFASASALVIVGDTIHNFVDGVAIGVSFLVNPGLGLITAFSTFLHEVPHEIGDFGILLKAGWQKRNIILVNILSASVAIVGAFSALLFAENEGLQGILLAISAGIFLYLGIIDFLPHAFKESDRKIDLAVPLILGVLIMALTLGLVPHEHEELHEDHENEAEHQILKIEHE